MRLLSVPRPPLHTGAMPALESRPAPGMRRTPLAAPPDHDLPLLAAECNAHRGPDWESLLEDGGQPALILGAERRLAGRR